MPLKDLAALYGRVALVMLAFAFVAGIVAGPVLQKIGLRSSMITAEDHAPMPELIRAKTAPVPEGQG